MIKHLRAVAARTDVLERAAVGCLGQLVRMRFTGPPGLTTDPTIATSDNTSADVDHGSRGSN